MPSLRLAALLVVLLALPALAAQEQRAKARISNAGFTITALPLLAAREWGVFTANGLEIEIILMQSSIVQAALSQGDIDYQAGVGPALDVGSMIDMPGGGLTAMVKTIQERPAVTKQVIRSLQSAKDEIRKSKPKPLDLIVKLLKMNREAAGEAYDQFLTTLNPTGIPSRIGMEILVRSIQSQGRHVDKKVAFTDVADDRLAIEVAKEMGYKIP